MRRAVHPVISVVILIAVTIVISLLVANYLFGIWNVEQEQFSITPVLYAQTSGSSTGGPILNLYIKNAGGKQVTIYKIEIRSDIGSWYNTSVYVIPANSALNVTIDTWKWSGQTSTPPPLKPGDRYRIIVYTENMGILFYDVVFS